MIRAAALRSHSRSGSAALVTGLLLLPTCAAAPRDPGAFTGPVQSTCCTHGDDAVTLQYLGVGGWLFRMGGAAIMTAPFFSNPGLLEVAAARLEADTARVDRYLPSVRDVSAILVGHAHYDHLMDVPYVARVKAPSARVYGSRTAVNLLRGDPGIDPDRLIEIESVAGDHEGAGRWVSVAGGRIRFMALRSAHAPHFLGIQLFEGEKDEPARSLPDRAAGWLEGQTLAYLIDFLDEAGEVILRVHYQDAASEPPAGFPPHPGDGIPVDVAILCPPGFEEVERYPEGILARLRPRLVLLGHWEDFFRPRSQSLRVVPGTDLDRFQERMEAALPAGSEWRRPDPGDVIRVRAGAGPGD